MFWVFLSSVLESWASQTVYSSRQDETKGDWPPTTPLAKKVYVEYSAAQCQLFKFRFDYCSFNIIGLTRTSQEYHHRFLRTDKNYNLCINVIKLLFNILKIWPNFGDFVIRYRFSMSADVGNWFWVHIRCQFGILKYGAAPVAYSSCSC